MWIQRAYKKFSKNSPSYNALYWVFIFKYMLSNINNAFTANTHYKTLLTENLIKTIFISLLFSFTYTYLTVTVSLIEPTIVFFTNYGKYYCMIQTCMFKKHWVIYWTVMCDRFRGTTVLLISKVHVSPFCLVNSCL